MEKKAFLKNFFFFRDQNKDSSTTVCNCWTAQYYWNSSIKSHCTQRHVVSSSQLDESAVATFAGQTRTSGPGLYESQSLALHKLAEIYPFSRFYAVANYSQSSHSRLEYFVIRFDSKLWIKIPTPSVSGFLSFAMEYSSVAFYPQEKQISSNSCN